MVDGRRRRKAKQAQRDAGRRRAREHESGADETPLLDEMREVLDAGHPLPVLGFVSVLILGTTPQPLQKPQEKPPTIGELVTAFENVETRETTALLAALGEMLIDDDELRARCRRTVAARTDPLPRWLIDLRHTAIHRAVRMTTGRGESGSEGDELILGVRFPDGQEMACAAHVDLRHTATIYDAFFVPGSIEAVLDVARANNTDPDTTFADVDLADARAALQQPLDQPLIATPRQDSDTWPASRALLRWLTRSMPSRHTAEK